MLRLIGLWSEPEDTGAFEQEYLGSHFPLLETLRGAQGTKTSRCIDGPYFRMTEVFFHTHGDLQSALDTQDGQRVLSTANALAEKYAINLAVLVVAEPA